MWLSAWIAVLIGVGSAAGAPAAPGAVSPPPASSGDSAALRPPWPPRPTPARPTVKPGTPGPTVGKSGTPSAEPSAEPSTEPSAEPSPGPTLAPPFATLPPGRTLPGDEACARAVTPAEETQPVNAPYNAVRGTIRLPRTFFDAGSHDPRAITDVASRVTGAFTGTTEEILQWTACKWGVDERIVRAQAQAESSWRQTMKGDWSSNPRHCAPGHGIGADGSPGWCPESWGILQVRYRFFSGAFPDAITSTAFNADTAYAVWRACYEGYEWWLSDFEAPGHRYGPGDAWGCLGRWYSGRWHDELAERYIECVRGLVDGRPACE